MTQIIPNGFKENISLKVQTLISIFSWHYSFLTNVIRLFVWIECLINVYVWYVCATAVIAVTTTSITSMRFIELVELYQWILNDLLLQKRIKQKYVCVLSPITNGFSLFFQCIEMNVNEPIDDAHAIVLNDISKYYSPETLNFYITT